MSEKSLFDISNLGYKTFKHNEDDKKWQIILY